MMMTLASRGGGTRRGDTVDALGFTVSARVQQGGPWKWRHDELAGPIVLCLSELRFIKVRLISRVYQSKFKLSPREDYCPSLCSTTSATPLGGLWVRPCWSLALQAARGHVLILQDPVALCGVPQERAWDEPPTTLLGSTLAAQWQWPTLARR
jgi:hypothetical protein